jgi:Cytochrome c2
MPLDEEGRQSSWAFLIRNRGCQGGEVEGFANYSGALKGITWDEAMLHKFIANPTSVASSTNMQFPGVPDADERQKIIDFIKQRSSEAAP